MTGRIELKDVDYEMINDCWDKLFSLSFRILADEEAAKDIVQEAFLKVAGKEVSWTNKAHFRNWIKKAVVNGAVDELRRRKKVNQVSLDTDEDWSALNYFAGSNGESDLCNRDLARFISLLTSRLPVKQRVIFSLIELEGVSHEEAADLTGLSKTQIKSNLSVAKRKVREILKRNM